MEPDVPTREATLAGRAGLDLSAYASFQAKRGGLPLRTRRRPPLTRPGVADPRKIGSRTFAYEGAGPSL